MKDRTLVVNGVSKGYSMTGWRVGYGAGPKELIKTMFKIQSQSTSGANTMSQWAAITALNGDQGFIQKYNETLVKRRNLVVSMMNKIDGLTCRAPLREPSIATFHARGGSSVRKLLKVM